MDCGEDHPLPLWFRGKSASKGKNKKSATFEMESRRSRDRCSYLVMDEFALGSLLQRLVLPWVVLYLAEELVSLSL